MEWIPNTIDAMGRLYLVTGWSGILVILIVILVGIIVWKHSSQVVEAISQFAASKKEEVEQSSIVIGHLEDIAKTNAETADRVGKGHAKTHEILAKAHEILGEIAKTSAETAERVSKLPSDRLSCKAMTREEMESLVMEVLAKGGIILGDAERGLLVDQKMQEQQQG